MLQNPEFIPLVANLNSNQPTPTWFSPSYIAATVGLLFSRHCHDGHRQLQPTTVAVAWWCLQFLVPRLWFSHLTLSLSLLSTIGRGTVGGADGGRPVTAGRRRTLTPFPLLSLCWVVKGGCRDLGGRCPPFRVSAEEGRGASSPFCFLFLFFWCLLCPIATTTQFPIPNSLILSLGAG